MDAIVKATPGCVFVTSLSHLGVGRYIREKCLEKVNGRFKFQLVDCNVRTYAADLSKSELAAVYIARNATPYEMSDVLYYLASEDRRGPMEDLLQRFIDGGRPTKVMLPGDPIEVI